MGEEISRLDILRMKKRRYKITDKQIAQRYGCGRPWVNRVMNEIDKSEGIFDTLEVMINEIERNNFKTK